jgi:CRP/FNR family transcriptional regulator, cyclic AMP receptor protein
MNRIDCTFAQRANAVLDLANDRLDHMVIAAGLDPAADLRYGNWRGFDLSGADLRGFNFTGADLTGARFDNAFIAGTIFDHAIYDPTSLQKAADYDELLKHRTPASLAAKKANSGRELLQNNNLFSKLSPKHIDRLATCVVVKSVARGTSIFTKGDPGSSLLAICQGTVKISVRSVDENHAVFNLMGKGDIFGEIALLDGRPRTADAVAVTDCELFTIERRDFLPLMREEPEIALTMIEILCARLRRTMEQADCGFIMLSGTIPTAVPSPPPIPGPMAPPTSGSGERLSEPTGAPTPPGAPTAAERSVVQLAFDTDRNKLHSAWQALANLADLCGHIAVSVKGEAPHGLDKSKLENGVYQPLREADLIE